MLRTFPWHVIFLPVFIGLIYPCAAALPILTPTPREMRWTADEGAWLSPDALVGVQCTARFPVPPGALERLTVSLGRTLPIRHDGNVRLVSAPMHAGIPIRTRHEAYTLVVNADGATIHAESAHGMHNGLISLAMLASPSKGLPQVSITDWPDQELRATYSGNLEEAERLLDWFVSLKLNMLVLEDGRLYDLDNADTCARIQQLAQRCRDNHIEFVPELQSLGWGQFVLAHEPRAVEAQWMERVPFPVRNNRIYSPDPVLPAPVKAAIPNFKSALENWTVEAYYDRWNAASSEEAAVVSTDDANALRLSLQETGSVRVYQTVNTQPNAQYVMRCRIKTADVAGQGAYIEVYGMNEVGVWTTRLNASTRSFFGTNDWTDTQITFFTGAFQRPRPGGAIEDETPAHPKEGYQRVAIFLRLEQSTGAAWFNAVEIEPIQSPNPLANVIATDSTRILVENEDASIQYEEGRDYTLHVPKLLYPMGLGSPMEVTLTNESRISEGDTLLLSFNQAQPAVITCCPSEPLYYDFMRKSIQNVVKHMNPRFLHIGHDEPQFLNRCQRCLDRKMSNEDLFVYAVKRIRQTALEANPALRVMLWDDAINPYQNAPHLKADTAAEKLPRDLIICVWWYDNDEWESQIDKSVEYFLDLGFEVTGSPWFRKPNAYKWAETFDNLKENPKALGIIYTSWGGVENPWDALELTAEHTWSFGLPAPPAF